MAAIAKTGLTTGNNIVSALPSSFEALPISEPSTILDSDGKEIAKFYEQNRQPVKLDDISPFMRKAIVSVEDERFYEHKGIDPQGIARAVVSNVTGSSRSGASTLTQQYVNNLLVNNQELTGAEESTISGQKDYADKIRELKYAVSIEKEMSKDEILEGYLNLVLFSGREYGVQAAAQHFYSVDAKDLNLQQSAMLAGMVQLPNVYNPINNPERSLDRRNKVLGNMLRAGAITKAEYDKAVKSDLELDPSKSPSGCIAADDNAYFCDYVTNLILTDDAFGETKQDRENLLYRGGLTMKTTLNSKLNKKAAKDARKAIDPKAKSNEDVFSSIVSVEPGTGNILTMAQNTTYDPAGGLGNTVINFAVERSLGGAGGFQGGSTMKPYTTLGWLSEGHNMWDTIDASRQNYSGSYKWKASCLPEGSVQTYSPWKVGNASRGFARKMKVDYGLYWSINSATVAEAAKIDLCSITKYINALGVKAQDKGENRTPTDFTPVNPSFIIGSEKITPLSQAAAFAAFANRGEFCEPRALTSVTDRDGNAYKVKKTTCSQAVEEQHVSDLNGTLSKIAKTRVAKGTINVPIAGKTGTNNGATSTWFVGYTTGISTASWVGRLKGQGEDRKENLMHGALINDQRAPSMVDSSTYAAPLWLDFMQEAVYDYPHESLGSARKAPVVKKEPSEDSSDSKSDSKEDSKSDSKKESSSESKSEEKESKSDSKESKSDSKSDSKKESKSDD
ncbi:transglycosylase domain-containing protein [Glutamicibacter protophormiae]|uniref:Membrane peptidoglycan carboxypeptidase n=1 Tax=Glutamicibacter protophormiae TaxID=37930 RepID=A0ABS4XMN7_GLUPR|nr:transglycosylase domain-containing protein [Glutamicibacter protophormiae]MBP2396973.1 membrane peptidoglycan carboxypeptidase [Glutamicibacter protophormiae]